MNGVKKECRIRKPSDFRKTYKEGRRFSSPHFVLYERQNNLPYARVGVSISKSHFRLATRRNRLRRIAKELFRKDVAARNPGRDFVLASRSGPQRPDMRDAIRELRILILKTKQ